MTSDTSDLERMADYITVERDDPYLCWRAEPGLVIDALMTEWEVRGLYRWVVGPECQCVICQSEHINGTRLTCGIV